MCARAPDTESRKELIIIDHRDFSSRKKMRKTLILATKSLEKFCGFSFRHKLPPFFRFLNNF